MTLLKKTTTKIIFILFIITLINLFQGGFTELLADEAYYWTYSNFLDWGYFDHPPMVAIWITISKIFFSTNELSLRFFSAFTYAFSIFLIWKTIDNPKKEQYVKLFFLTVLSSVLLSVYGFITVPDTPLVFFLALFLFSYKHYLKHKNINSYLLIIVSVSGLLYSKYQGIIVVFFVLLSNLKVLKDYKLWISFVTILLLYYPHLYWQYQHDFITFKYHLVERSTNSEYEFTNTLLHFVNCLIIVGLTFPLVYLAFFKNLKNKDAFNKALNYIIIGFIGFFFFMTFKGHVQAQWVVPISIPLIIISFNYFISNKKYYKLFAKLSLATIFLVFVARIFIIIDVLPVQLDFHGNKKWVSELKNKLKDRTPLFINSYQRTSLFWFYSGIKPYQYNSFWGRNNQYNIFPYNRFYTLDKALAFGSPKKNKSDSILEKSNRIIYFKELTNLHVNNSLTIKHAKVTNFLIGENSLSVKIIHKDTNFTFSNNNFIIYFFNKEKKYITQTNVIFRGDKNIVPAGESLASMNFNLAENINKTEIYYFKIGMMPHSAELDLKIGSFEKCIIK